MKEVIVNGKTKRIRHSENHQLVPKIWLKKYTTTSHGKNFIEYKEFTIVSCKIQSYHTTPHRLPYCTTLQSKLQPNQLCSLFVLYYYTTICFITVVIFRKPYLRFKGKNTIYSNEEELRSTKSINWFSFLVYKMLLRTDRLVTM